MEIWLIEGGEKTGPFQSYLIRERIGRGELDGGEMAWHESSPDWVPLREVAMFRTEFHEEEVEVEVPPPIPARPRPLVRFWARWFDFQLNVVVVFGLMRVLGLDIAEAMISPVFMLTYLLPGVLLEAIAIHQWGTTPGKGLLGARVQLRDGARLELGRAVVRSFRVHVLGMGMFIFPFPLICHALSLWFLMKMRCTFWDRVGGSEVRVRKVGEGRIVVFVVLFLGLGSALMLLLTPSLEELMKENEKERPEQREVGNR
ncbi:MAG: RDD family protein [Verrucomicrobia bacterium]|nr:RDD family protein [Verrucomicrobiota bacterium]MDA1007046.1 RDD family protein [Verrucomicrobiota bacterium]